MIDSDAQIEADFDGSYSKALDSAPTSEEALTITLNRALMHLKCHQFEAALHDLEEVSLEIDLASSHLSEKLLFRKSQALYYLQRFRECCDTYTILVKRNPDLKSAKADFNRALKRLAEQQNGKYQFKQMQLEATRNRPPYLDHATYVGPVSVRQTSSSGRGLFTTEAVRAGDLLFCEKAFAYAFYDAKNPTMDLSLLMNAEANTMTLATQADLLPLIIQKLYKTPSLISSVTDLYHGEYKPLSVSEIDGSPIIDR